MAKVVKKDIRLEDQSVEELNTQLTAAQSELLGFKKGLISGELKNTATINATRRQIARIKTILKTKEGDK